MMKADLAERLVAHQHQFLSFLKRRLGDPGAAEEVLQAAWLKATEKADGIRAPESGVAWFYRLLRNAVVDQRRRSARESRVEGLAAASLVEHQELKDSVCHCVGALAATLEPAQARLLRRVDLEGAAVPEAAREEGISPNNAAVRLHRARAALREKLKFVCGACARHGCLDCGCPKGPPL